MWEDPIVAEVHRAREKLAAESNYDIHEFFAGLRKRQQSLGDRLVSPKEGAELERGTNGDHSSGSTDANTSSTAPAT